MKPMYMAALVSLLVSACGGESSPTPNIPSNDSPSTAQVETPPTLRAVAQSKVQAVYVDARYYQSDTRRENRDGQAGLNPILSKAPKNCDAGLTLHAKGTPLCTDYQSAAFYDASQHGGTLVDASVFVPPHRAGESLPVILHSHGWSGEKLAAMQTLPECNEAQKPYRCPLPERDRLMGIFNQIDALASDLYRQGYIIVSFNQRGSGQSEGVLSVMNSYLESQDGLAVIDWIAEQGRKGHLPIKVDAKGDFSLGLLGGSYGGGFQFPLAALDQRIDALVPIGTWNSLSNSLYANGALKSGWGNLLCLAATGKPQHELLTNACAAMFFPFIRRLDQIIEHEKISEFLHMSGLSYFQDLEAQGAPYKDGELPFVMPKVDALLVQGNRDVLFPLKQAFDNFSYLNAKGGDVRLLSNESGHINPLASQTPGGDDCGSVDTMEAIRIWFDVKLRGQNPALLDAIPTRCISLNEGNAVALDAIPGLDPDKKARTWYPFDLNVGQPGTSETCHTVHTITDDHTVLAGQSHLRNLEITDNTVMRFGAAYLGICIERDGVIHQVDDQIMGFRPTRYPEAAFIAIGEALKQGDRIGLYAAQANANMNFLSLSTAKGVFDLLASLTGKDENQDAVAQRLNDLKQQRARQAVQGAFLNRYRATGELYLPLITYP